jgi:hypothetical protein
VNYFNEVDLYRLKLPRWRLFHPPARECKYKKEAILPINSSRVTKMALENYNIRVSDEVIDHTEVSPSLFRLH